MDEQEPILPVGLTVGCTGVFVFGVLVLVLGIVTGVLILAMTM